MKTARMLLVIAIIPVSLCQFPPEKPNAEEVLKEFFSSNPPNAKLLTVLEREAVEPYRTKLVERFLAQKPSPEEASKLLAQKPPEPYAQQAWKIVESDGTLRDKCHVMNYGSPEYQDKAFASLFERTLSVEEFAFYLMQETPPQRFIGPLWDRFLKLKPSKEGLLFAIKSARVDFQEFAVLYLLDRFSRELTPSELDSVSQIISEILEKQAKEREGKLIEIMTQK